MAIKKIIDWAGKSWIVTVIVLAWFGRRWILTGVVAAGAYIYTTAGDAEKERVYEQYKSELDAMNCGKIMVQINGLDKRLSEQNKRLSGLDSACGALREAHRKEKREALDKGITDDAAWAAIDAKEKTISASCQKKTAEINKKTAEIKAEYIPRMALQRAANEKRCFVD